MAFPSKPSISALSYAFNLSSSDAQFRVREINDDDPLGLDDEEPLQQHFFPDGSSSYKELQQITPLDVHLQGNEVE